MFLNEIINEISSVFILELLFSNSNRIKKVLPLGTNVTTLLEGERGEWREGRKCVCEGEEGIVRKEKTMMKEGSVYQ